MRSGYTDNKWEDEYYQEPLRVIVDRNFSQKVFSPFDAIKSLKSDNGCFTMSPYRGEKFNPAENYIVPQGWDHEHCDVCRFTIKTDYTFWVNKINQMLCDECHDYLLKMLAR